MDANYFNHDLKDPYDIHEPNVTYSTSKTTKNHIFNQEKNKTVETPLK